MSPGTEGQIVAALDRLAINLGKTMKNLIDEVRQSIDAGRIAHEDLVAQIERFDTGRHKHISLLEELAKDERRHHSDPRQSNPLQSRIQTYFDSLGKYRKARDRRLILRTCLALIHCQSNTPMSNGVRKEIEDLEKDLTEACYPEGSPYKDH